MNTLTKTYFLIALSITLFSCKKDRDTNLPQQEILNITYGTEVSQNMDIYLPSNRNSETGIIIFLHGGGFIAGDKAEFTNQAKALAANGFAVVNANYRLVDITGILETPIIHQTSAITIHHQIADVEAIMNMVISKSAEWNINSNKLGIAGHSAGGTLALLAGYKNRDKVKVVGNWAGATNLSFPDESYTQGVDPRLLEVYFRLLNKELINENRLAFMAVSPFWVAFNGQAINTINIRPEFNVVFNMPDASKAEYESFTEVLNDKNISNKHVEVAGADHGFGQPGNWDVVIAETTTYFNGIFNQ